MISINTLIIDDHPLIVEATKIALNQSESSSKDLSFKIEVATTCDGAINILDRYPKNETLDLVFLDIRLKPSKDGNILSGEDLGIRIRNQFEDVKIIVITSFNDNLRLNSILKNVDPDALMVKNDLTPKKFLKAIESVLNDETYYCKTSSKLIRILLTNDITLDAYDRRILYELSIGTKMNELPNLLPLSLGGIENRKRRLLDIFNVSSRDDRQLIQGAKEKGFI
ncbi:response regulator [Pontimicrobium aquaticum]|uniref:Response regulator transcription factor n=1 Tax=Pontimicrobium aquaticum TaxID=2565367 RepID=A0A4U0F033_9FLAO|nr:response regulator [Pontimicrobium aquaticum]TJY37696.1 response regulator transcription factor [Pontimicrobium aquaticum]